MELIGNIVTIIGLAVMLTGVVGLYKFKDFYLRLLVLAKIDTVGAITFMIGIIIRHGFSSFSLKVLLIMVLFIILNPLTAHILARAAYQSIEGITEEQYIEGYDDGHGGK
ncbi:MAG: monovalent cation/H(+) antiporter subunit G [Oscillospiraceae bacterium]|nr:monovalent cation/H(+) antiporter subunit G [Oscillospiraceae bacterium]